MGGALKAQHAPWRHGVCVSGLCGYCGVCCFACLCGWGTALVVVVSVTAALAVVSVVVGQGQSPGVRPAAGATGDEQGNTVVS